MMKLTLGPIAYHWSPESRRDFYARIADEAPVDEVYLGEVICSKRAPFSEADLPETIERLQRGGKKVILSSLAEVMLPRERKAMAELAALETPDIEFNNVAGLFERGARPHRIGPFLNAYNEATIDWMARQGATHICLPTELPSASIALATAAARQLGLGVEMQVFGRASLAVSARCYHARAHQRTKDNCLYVCEDDPDGMQLSTRDNRPVLRINGIQTLSDTYMSLLPELASLGAMGVTHARLMPQKIDMVALTRLFRDVLDERESMNTAEETFQHLCQGIGISNGFFHGVAGYREVRAAATP